MYPGSRGKSSDKTSETSGNENFSVRSFKDFQFIELDNSDSDHDGLCHRDGINTDIAKAKLLIRLLLAVQGLRSINDSNQSNVYVRNPHCEDSLQDILMLFDSKTAFGSELEVELGKRKVVQRYLIPLLVSSNQDENLTFYLLELLVKLTSLPAPDEPKSNELIGYLQDYKFAFNMNSDAIIRINMLLTDYFNIGESQRTLKSEQLIESIVLLYRNLLQVPEVVSEHTGKSSTHEKALKLRFIATLSMHNSLDVFIFLVQQSSKTLLKKIGALLLEIFYHIFSLFEPEWLFQNSNQTKISLAPIYEEEKGEETQGLSGMSSRQARFDCNIKTVRNLEAGSKAVQNSFKNDCYQSLISTASKNLKDGKVNLKYASVLPSDHYKEILDKEEFNEPLKQIIRDYAIDFVEHAYGILVKQSYEEIHKKKRPIRDQDRVYFFVIIGFGLEVFRYNLCSKKGSRDILVGDTNPENYDNYDLQSINAVLQIPIFEYIYDITFKHAYIKKRLFNVQIYHAGLYSYIQILHCIKEIRSSASEAARKSIHIFTQEIFRKEYSSIVRGVFSQYSPKTHDPKLVRTLAECIEVLLDVLEELFNGDKDNTPQYIELRTSFKYEIAVFSNYEVMNVLLNMIRADRLEENGRKANDSMAGIMKRVVYVLKAEWLFFQIGYLLIFQGILNSRNQKIRLENQGLFEIVDHIVKSFFYLLKMNKMASVECLFRFISRAEKEEIINNYVIPEGDSG